MNILPLLILLTGCAAPIEKLTVEAKECVSGHVNAKGIIGKPSDEERKECWAEVNKRMESAARYEAKKERERAERCPRGQVLVVDKKWDRSGCIDVHEMRRIFNQ